MVLIFFYFYRQLQCTLSCCFVIFNVDEGNRQQEKSVLKPGKMAVIKVTMHCQVFQVAVQRSEKQTDCSPKTYVCRLRAAMDWCPPLLLSISWAPGPGWAPGYGSGIRQWIRIRLRIKQWLWTRCLCCVYRRGKTGLVPSEHAASVTIYTCMQASKASTCTQSTQSI